MLIILQHIHTFTGVDNAARPAVVGIPFDVDTELGACGIGAHIGM